MTATQISHIQPVCQQDATLKEPRPYKRQALTSLDHTIGSRWPLHHRRAQSAGQPPNGTLSLHHPPPPNLFPHIQRSPESRRRERGAHASRPSPTSPPPLLPPPCLTSLPPPFLPPLSPSLLIPLPLIPSPLLLPIPRSSRFTTACPASPSSTRPSIQSSAPCARSTAACPPTPGPCPTPSPRTGVVYEPGKGDPPPTHAPAPLAKALAADDLETGGQGDGKVGGATTGAKKVPNMPGILATPTLTASPRVLPITV